jgi:hypothetical protein
MTKHLQNKQERRIRQRRRFRTGFTFPLKDGRGCIVPFDRSRSGDRRLADALSESDAAGRESDRVSSGHRSAGDHSGMPKLPSLFDSARDFCIAGELIAHVNNLYNSQSPGSWKELELYQTPHGTYVCLEIWRTVVVGRYEQYWLTSCDDLQGVREFFGTSSLAGELFDEVSSVLIQTTE